MARQMYFQLQIYTNSTQQFKNHISFHIHHYGVGYTLGCIQSCILFHKSALEPARQHLYTLVWWPEHISLHQHWSIVHRPHTWSRLQEHCHKSPQGHHCTLGEAYSHHCIPKNQMINIMTKYVRGFYGMENSAIKTQLYQKKGPKTNVANQDLQKEQLTMTIAILLKLYLHRTNQNENLQITCL